LIRDRSGSSQKEADHKALQALGSGAERDFRIVEGAQSANVV
jgi:hypothetical protein